MRLKKIKVRAIGYGCVCAQAQLQFLSAVRVDYTETVTSKPTPRGGNSWRNYPG